MAAPNFGIRPQLNGVNLGLVSDDPRGFAPYAFAMGGGPHVVSTVAFALAASGGTLLLPVDIPSPMLLQSVSFWNTDAATARGPVEIALYREITQSNLLALVTGSGGSLASFTPTAAAARTVPLTTPGLLVEPGTYWLAVKNNGAATLGIGTAAAGTMLLSSAQTKTLTTAAFGATLDAVLATWAKQTSLFNFRLNGRVFNQAGSF